MEGFAHGNEKLREKSRKIRFTNPVPFLSLCKFLHKPEFQVPNTTIKNFPSHFFMHILSNAGVMFYTKVNAKSASFFVDLRLPSDVDGILSLMRKLCSLLVLVPGH